MAKNLNINSSVIDDHYRYKMPPLQVKDEGKGNGKKTVIPNMLEIAKSLDRPPAYITKYFGIELGAQTKSDNDRHIVNGTHDAVKLQELLGGFIKTFVLCSRCGNPETTLQVSQKRQIILQTCAACGHRANIDLRHKLTTFILKNPPPQQPKGTYPTNGVKKEKKADDKIKSSPVDDNQDDDDDWGDDVSDAAVLARQRELSSAAKNLTINDDLAKSEKKRIDIFYSFVRQRKVAGQLTGAAKEKEILAEAERLDIKDKATLVLVELLFDTDVLKQIKQHKTLLQRFTGRNEVAQKYLLNGFELLIGEVHAATLMAKTAKILNTLYEEDILDEETVIQWSEKPLEHGFSKELREKAKPFIDWLKQAESEDSEEDEDDDEDEDGGVVYSDRPLAFAAKEVKNVVAVAAEDDDDLNIDDI